ncbi:hypothetical protein JTE90_029022 [Oedothorax gibbosus]|uniref:C-type lectin domain-containing protein n=1 Tax=Oedothorax gibbosus TaxID=931172 RepID=A0AAV6UHL2_9ARAC|nr:hypothetical protein JTE90_029022 [Oedothorax gibbosus]
MDFLFTFFLLSAKENLWFGLHDRVNESVYSFDDGTPVTNATYFNWEPYEPLGFADEREDCVELVMLSTRPGGKPGQWNDVDCGIPYQFICQRKKGKFDPDYTDPKFCTSELGKGWKKNASCVYIVEEYKNWTEAENFCIESYGGHLVTITDFTTNSFLNYILQGQEENMWIGITTKNEYQQQWSSGWFVSYENWAEGVKPHDFGEGSCASRKPNGKWFIHSCNKMLPFICETTTDKTPAMKRNLEDVSCPDRPKDWRDLGGDFCYYFDLKDTVSWYEANFRCLRRGGTLAGIHSAEESLILQNYLKFMQTSIYYKWHYVHIGLHRDFRVEFAWADGVPYDFKNWEHNDGENEVEKCVMVNTDTMKWHDIDCTQARGYICSVLKIHESINEEGLKNTVINGYSTTVYVATVIGVLLLSSILGVIVFYCCFRKFKKEMRLQMHYRKYESGSGKVFDGDTYANAGSCHIRRYIANITFLLCFEVSLNICDKSMEYVLLILICFHKVFLFRAELDSTGRTLKQENTNFSCSKGWYPFGNMCYKLGGDDKIRRLPWDEAAQICRNNYNGNLATIDTKEINGFLVAFFLLNVKEDLWFGLHDKLNESEYSFEDGTIVTSNTFFNWEPQEPSGIRDEPEDCVEMVILSTQPGGKPGQWNDNSCGVYFQFICQKKKPSEALMHKFHPDYSDPRFCTSEVGKGWKKEASCFYIVKEQRRWAEAENFFVQNYGGHLATITDFTIQLFLDYILQEQEYNFWIGITTKNEFQQQWSSGWYVSYENWAEGEKPHDYSEGSCASRKPNGKWVIHSCNRKLPFICETTTDKPPVLKHKLKSATCPNSPAGWRDLGGDFCYYIDLKNTVTWFEANFRCLRRGGTLAGIHSAEESLILQNFLKFMKTDEHYATHFVHIGLYRDYREVEFVWADGMPYDFKNWEHNDGENELEKCVMVHTGNMKWHDVDCVRANGYACSIIKVSSNHVQGREDKETVCTTLISSGYSTTVYIATIIGVLLISSFLGVVICYCIFRKFKQEIRLQMHYRHYENDSERVT